MFCTECGKKLVDGEKFCTSCGTLQSEKARGPEGQVKETTMEKEPVFVKETVVPKVRTKEERWWDRLFKVLYISAYVILPFILIVVWEGNSCSSYYSYCTGDEAFWATLFTLIGYVAFIRITKITLLYIIKGRVVNWGKEFKRLF